MTDSYTDELFQIDASLATPVVFPISRLVLDPERFLDDSREEMSKRGMGAVYTRTSGGELLRIEKNTPERERLINEYYHPHHHRLTEAVQSTLEHHGYCLIIDCHSFASVPLPHEPNQAADRPDICLGTDEFHSPEELVIKALELLKNAGFRSEINRPFSGSLVPGLFYGCDRRVISIMIEVNRRLYMDETSGGRLPTFNALRARLHSTLKDIICGLAQWAHPSNQP